MSRKHGKRPSTWFVRAAPSIFSAAAPRAHTSRSTPIASITATSPLRATFHHTPAICRKALDLIAGGRFQAGAFITGHAHLYELNRVFKKLMNRNHEIKTAIVP